MPTDDDRPFVDDDTRGGLTDAIERVLETVAPDSFAAGGPSPQTHFSRYPRNYDRLKEFESIYLSGGPLTEFVDTRALMTYGTGVEFTTEEELILRDGFTVAEWLHDQLPLIDQVMIDRGVHSYVFGDAWPEVVQDRSGGLSHVNLVHPTTVDPDWDAHGEITDLRQITVGPRGKAYEQPLTPDDHYGHWFYKKETAGPLGDSLLAQNYQEVQWYSQNQQQRANAIRLHGSPKYHIQVGSDGQSIPDKIMRRVRDRFRSTDVDEKTNWTTGGDVEVSELDAPGFEGMDNITETDVAKLASGFGVPLEWTNFGSAGLGEGTPAESRLKKFERQARAEQRRAVEQVLQFPIRYIVDELSPFPRGIDVGMEFGDVISDPAAIAEWLGGFEDHYTSDEIRHKFGDPPLTDEQRQQIEERQEQGGDEMGGGFFTADPDDAPDPLSDDMKAAFADGGTDFLIARSMQSVPDNAVSIDDPSECGGSVIQGPRGGTYCVPAGGEDDDGTGGGAAGRGEDPNPSVDLEHEVDSMSLEEAGIVDGSNHAGMRITELEDGGEVFVEEDYEDWIADKELAGVSVYESLDLPIPDHHYYDDTGEMAKEGVVGTTFNDAMREGGVDVDVDEESVVDAFAASLLTGDTDMHGGNMMIRDDGVCVPVDVEGSGGPVRDKSDKETKVTAMLERGDIDVDYDDIWDRAQEMAGDIDPDAIPDGETDMGGMAADNIRENIEAIQA